MNIYYKIGTDLYFNAQKITITKQVNAPDTAIISLNYDTGLEIPTASSITIYIDNEVYFSGIYESSDNGSINAISNLGILNTITMSDTVFTATATPIADIASIFSATYGSAVTFVGESTQSIDYVWTHQSLLEALGIISEITNESWYQSGSSEITWIGLPASFVSSDISLTDNVDPLHASRNPKLGFITDLTTQVEGSSPVNLIYAFGSEGVSLNEATLWPDGTPIVGNTTYDGFTIDQTNSSIKKDSITITQHIRKDYLDAPPTITDPDDAGYAAAIVVSANTLLKRAMAEIELREEGTKNYYVEGSAGSILDLYPTQSLQIKYTGATAYITCNAVSINHIFDLDEGYRFTITASTSYRPKLSVNQDQNVLIGMSKQIKALEKTSAVRRRFDISAIPDPLSLTQVKALDASGLLLSNDSDVGITIEDDGSINFIDKVSISSSGFLGVGTTTPAADLTILKESTGTEYRCVIQSGTGTFNWVFNKSRGTISSPTAIALNDWLSVFNWYAHDGIQLKRAAYLGVRVAQTVSTNNVGAEMIFSVGSNPERAAFVLKYTGVANFYYDVDLAADLTVDGDTTFNGSIASAWITPTLNSGFTNVGGSEATVKYRIVGDLVFLQGAFVTSGAIAPNTTIFTLNAGYRPLSNQRFTVLNYTTAGITSILIDSSGNVKNVPAISTAQSVSFGNLSFFTS